MPSQLDNILSVLIPIVIFGAIVVFIYFKAKDPIDTFFGKIRDMITGNKDEDKGSTNKDPGDYKIDYRRPDY